MAQRRKTIRAIQQEHRIFNQRGKAYLPTPPLYTIDKALYSKRGTLDGLNMSLSELAPIPALLLIPPSLQQALLQQAPTTAIPLPVLAVD